MTFLGPSLRRSKVHDRPGRRVVLAAVASLAVNAVVLVLLARAGAFTPPKPLEKQDVSIAQLSAKDWSANRIVKPIPGLTPAPQPPTPLSKAEPQPVPPKVKPDEPKSPGRVVDVAPSKDHRPPENPRFLSEQDNRVDKETRSRLQGSGVFRNRAPTVVPGQTERHKAGEGGADDETKQAREGKGGTNQKGGKPQPRQPQQEPEPQKKDDKLALLERPTLPKGPPTAPPPSGGDEGLGTPGLPGTPQQEKQKQGDSRLVPSVDSMSKITAGPSNDVIDPDVEEGDVTALNTKGFRFASFWNRFKGDVSEHWYPLVRYELVDRDPNGALYGNNDRVTGLRIVLDGTGAVKKIDVVQSCGLAFLDQLAVKAVREASPFYNLPPALLDAKGELAFDFGFLVERNRGVPVHPHYRPTAP
jgi:TonB family protein